MEDCYFYYNSACAKGSACPFRHEPAALNQEVVCSFWANGNCNKTSCPYRHSDLNAKNRQNIPCYWESRPGGCRKSRCPFQHQGVVSSSTSSPPPPPSPSSSQVLIKPQASKIIVNKNKLNELSTILANAASERVVIPASKPPVKERLGSKKLSVKDRLGFKRPSNDAGEELSEEEEDEEKVLRAKAIKSLDLRRRIKMPDSLSPPRGLPSDEEAEEEEDESSEFIVKSLVQKVKKESKKKKKKSKKAKKSKRRRSSSSEASGLESFDDIVEELEKEEEENVPAKKIIKKSKSEGIAVRTLRELRTQKTDRKRKSSGDGIRVTPKKVEKSDQIFESAVKDMDDILKDGTINEAINESADVLKQLEELINS